MAEHRLFPERRRMLRISPLKLFWRNLVFCASAIVRRIEGRKPQGAKCDAKYAYVADVCVTRFNEQIDEIERWRSSEIVGFSAARLRAEAREVELNQAIADLSREEFLAGNFDLKSLFSRRFDA